MSQIKTENPSKDTSSSGLGCLTLFALPFAAGGTFVAYLLLASLWSYAAVQGWREVPAQILSTSLQMQHGDSTTYKVTARYEYRFEGRTFIGQRVGLHGGSDNLGDWQNRVYRELSTYRESSRPFRAYVNPDDPQQAILYRELRWEVLGLYAVFALVFGGAGYGLFILGFVGRRRWRRERELKSQHPEQPWRHRTDWAAGEVRSSARPAMIFSMVFAAFWNLISLPMLFLLPREVLDKGNRLALIGLIFPVIGIGLIVWAVRNLLRARKFGRSRLALETLPGVVGGPLAGTIHTGCELRPEKGFHITLDGISRRVVRRGRDRSTQDSILHQEALTVPPERTGLDMTGTTVPVRFAIPYEAPPTSDKNSSNRVFWRLSVAAEVPGIDYAASFEVPVYRTADSSPDYALPSDARGETTGGDELSARDGVRVSREGGALVIALAAARNKGTAFGLTFFLAIWSGAIALMLKLGAPLFFPIIFGVFAFFMLVGVLNLWCGATRIEVRYDELCRRGGLFALGRQRVWRGEEIERLQPATGMQAGRKLFYRLQLVSRAGRTKTIATRLDSRAQAESLARRIEAVLRGGEA